MMSDQLRRFSRWCGPTYKACFAAFLFLSASGGSAAFQHDDVVPASKLIIGIFVLMVGVGFGLSLLAIGQVLDTSSKRTWKLIFGAGFLVSGVLSTSHVLSSLTEGDSGYLLWGALTLVSAGFAVTLAWLVDVLATPALRGQAEAKLVTAATVASGLAAMVAIFVTSSGSS
jgi:hypothetical protein